MRDIKYANHGCCGLSKGTQSDGLISDTSTEEYVSSSSTEDLKESKILEEIKANETKEVPNEPLDSKNLTCLEQSTSLYQLQTGCQLYIRWGVLMGFGILLWVALWIADLFNPNPFLKEGWLIDLATAKKVTLKAGAIEKPAPSTWWFANLWSYTWNSIISVTTVEALIFILCVVILMWLETHMRNKWGATSGRLCYDQFYKSLLNVSAKLSETEDNIYDLNALGEELEPTEPEVKSYSDNLSKFSHGDVKNLLAQDQIGVKSKSAAKRRQCLNQRETSSTENCISKPLKGPRNLKRPLQLSSGKNHCILSRRSNNLSRDVVTSEMVFNQPNIELSRVSSMSQSDKTKSFPEQSNLTCPVFNVSTSFMSEKIETWFELPNAHQAEKVINSFDTELEEVFETRRSPSPLSFKESTQVLQRFDSRAAGCDCGEGSNVVALNLDYTGGIISSSPAFRRFLVNLAKDRLSEPYS